jgi:hypothetical protein
VLSLLQIMPMCDGQHRPHRLTVTTSAVPCSPTHSWSKHPSRPAVSQVTSYVKGRHTDQLGKPPMATQQQAASLRQHHILGKRGRTLNRLHGSASQQQRPTTCMLDIDNTMVFSFSNCQRTRVKESVQVLRNNTPQSTSLCLDTPPKVALQ